MKIRNLLKSKPLLIAAIVICPAFSNKVLSQARQQDAITIKYNFPESKTVRYHNSEKMVQTMEIEGQSMVVNITGAFGCTMKSLGTDNKNIKLEVTVDTLGQTTDSPMGYSGGAVNDVIGKTFNILVAPSGKIADCSEAGKITYNIEGSGESDLSTIFSNYFPKVPENAIKVGDTWNSADTIKSKTSSMTMTMVVNSVNKFAGIETVDGIECAKISSEISGTQDIYIYNASTDLKMKGPFTGTSEFLFAIKDGYFLKNSVMMKMNGNLDMTQPETMSFPVVIDRTEVNEVVR